MRLGRLLLAPLRSVARVVRATRRTVAAVPDVVDAILVLPGLSRQLHVVELQTATLADVHDELRRLRRDTSHLPRIDERLERMAFLLDRVDGNTAAVHELASVVTPLRGAAVRVGAFSDRFGARRGGPGPTPPPGQLPPG